MNTFQNLRKKYWTYVIVWVFCIYSTLYIVRPICEYLKKITPFSFLMNIFIISILGILVIAIWRTKCIKSISSFLFLLITLLFYFYGILKIQYPEEKLHFVEYGFLAYLIFKALDLDFKKPQAYLLAFILTSLLGWGDEGIQHLLPNRYYQNEDVLLNSLSGGLGLLLTFISRRDLGSDHDQ